MYKKKIFDQSLDSKRKRYLRLRNLAVAVAVLVPMLLTANPAAAQVDQKRWCYGPDIWLNMVDANRWVVNIEQANGWQITASMTIPDCKLLGIGTPSIPPVYPFADRTGYFVFDDPNPCPSFVSFSWKLNAYEAYYCQSSPSETYEGCVPPYWPDDSAWPDGQPPCRPDDTDLSIAWFLALEESGLTWPKDETWAEITPGLSSPDVIPSVCPVGDCPEPEYGPLIWNHNGDWQLVQTGPDLGSTADDVRFGSWSRMPSLVVLADHGPGVWTTPPGENDNSPAADFFDLPYPRKARNLAGLFGSAAYSLKGGMNRTSLTAHVNVPYGLFTPVVLVDNEITNPVEVDGVLCGTSDGLYRMDGGPLTCREGGFPNHDGILNETTVTVRVFMVDGVAPDFLEDQDNDGDVDIRDARFMGLKTLSNQEIFRFSQYHEGVCGPYFDFDGNDFAATCVLPGRPGDITRPPR